MMMDEILHVTNGLAKGPPKVNSEPLDWFDEALNSSTELFFFT